MQEIETDITKQEALADALRIWSAKFRGVAPGNMLPWGQLKPSEQNQWIMEAQFFNTFFKVEVI